MALAVNHPLDEVVVYCHAADISTAGSSFSRAPFRGKVIKVGSIIKNAITVADNTVTTKIAGTAITGGVITVTQSGSAAGQVNTATPTGANNCNEDDNIEFAYTGSTTTCQTTFFAVIRRA
jgi:hypothetical protein